MRRNKYRGYDEEDSYRDRGQIALEIGGMIAIVGVGGSLMGFMIASTVNTININDTYAAGEKEIEDAKNLLTENLSKSLKLDKLQVASIEMSSNGDKNFLKFFGSVKNETIASVEENKYVNIMVEISPETSRELSSKIASLAENRFLDKMQTQEFTPSLTRSNIRPFKLSEPKEIKKTTDELKAFFDTLVSATGNTQNAKVEEIFEASQMNNAVSKAYRYMRPEYLSDVKISGLFTHGYTTFINAGVMTTSVSQVAKDETRGVSYFFIDTVQGREQNKQIVPTSCRLRIEVEGTELEQEQVYKKFVDGEYSSLIEVVRNSESAKYGVSDNQLVTDIEEIELT